jgi:thiamine-phosphate pyrophosphorylase
MAHNVAARLRLMLVTDDRLVQGRDIVELALAAERGGVTCVQLRLKQANPRDLVALARALIHVLTVPVLVNDRPDVAIASGAAGVHLGPDDFPVELVRRVAPPDFLVGASVGNESEALRAGQADYWGVGPWRETLTKGDAGGGLGPQGFGRIVHLASGKLCVAIGGIQPEDVPAVLEAGGHGVAVASGILSSVDVEAAARRYRASSSSAQAQLSPPNLPNRP